MTKNSNLRALQTEDVVYRVIEPAWLEIVANICNALERSKRIVADRLAVGTMGEISINLLIY